MAYQAVLEAITTNQMKPGDRLSEYMVADWLKISRTPAREGLRRLESEGLLTSHQRRGLVVASFDEAAVHELYAWISALPLSERRGIAGLPAARADVFPVALATLLAVAELGGFAALRNSGYNLRYGLADALL